MLKIISSRFSNDIDGDANKVEENSYKKYLLARVNKETAKVLSA